MKRELQRERKSETQRETHHLYPRPLRILFIYRYTVHIDLEIFCVDHGLNIFNTYDLTPTTLLQKVHICMLIIELRLGICGLGLWKRLLSALLLVKDSLSVFVSIVSELTSSKQYWCQQDLNSSYHLLKTLFLQDWCLDNDEIWFKSFHRLIANILVALNFQHIFSKFSFVISNPITISF